MKIKTQTESKALRRAICKPPGQKSREAEKGVNGNKTEFHLNVEALFICLFTVQACVKVGPNEFWDGFNVVGKLFRTTENICFLLHCVPQKTR